MKKIIYFFILTLLLSSCVRDESLIVTPFFPFITLSDNGVLNNTNEGTIFYTGGHFYASNGANHVFTTSSGVKTNTTTINNTVLEKEVYRYEFDANELHKDEHITFILNGFVNTASASDNFNVSFYVNGYLTHSIVYDGGNVDNVGNEIVYSGTIREEGVSGTFVDYAKMIVGNNLYSEAELTVHPIDTTSPLIFNVTVKWNNAKTDNIFSVSQGVLRFDH